RVDDYTEYHTHLAAPKHHVTWNPDGGKEYKVKLDKPLINKNNRRDRDSHDKPGEKNKKCPSNNLAKRNPGIITLTMGKQGRDKKQRIRFLPSGHNGGAGKLFRNFCPGNIPTEVESRLIGTQKGCWKDTRWYSFTTTETLNILQLNFNNMPNLPDDGIPANECYPKVLIDNPGFALLNNDPWYGRNQGNRQYRGNSTRKPTDAELFESLGLLRCEDGDCTAKLAELGIESAPLVAMPPTAAVSVDAVATPVDAVPAWLSRAVGTAAAVHEEIRSLITPPLEPVFFGEE
ncbi:hypothetical protein PspLS_08179, partial [Pyricularia sp. CBS 133598]